MAKYVYPAVFTHEAEGGYSITFPDLPDCATSAETLEEGIEMAADALCLMLYDMEEGGAVPPEPSDVKSIVCAENQLVTLIRCDTIEYRKFFDNRAVKKTLTIPAWLNTMAERQGVNFSMILQNALKAELHIKRIKNKRAQTGRSPLSFAVLRHSTPASVQLAGWRRRSARPRWRQRSAKTAR